MSQVGTSREHLLSRAFVGLADTLVDDYDIIDLLDRLVSYSVELLAAEATGILLVDSQCHLQVVASSSEDADVMELLQVEADQGPCVECFHTGAPVSVADLADAAIAVAGVRGRCRQAGGLPVGARAAPAAAWRGDRDDEPVPPSAGGPARVIIEQAKGVLAQQGTLSMNAAFDRLRRYARNHNALLSEVARQVVETDLATDVLALAAHALHSPATEQR